MVKPLMKQRASKGGVMKQNIKVLIAAVLVTFGLSFQANAWISSEPMAKLYTFKFKMAKETFEYEQKAPSYEDAFDKAAQACYKHFKGGRRLSEDTGLDIIDVCANPRS